MISLPKDIQNIKTTNDWMMMYKKFGGKPVHHFFKLCHLAMPPRGQVLCYFVGFHNAVTPRCSLHRLPNNPAALHKFWDMKKYRARKRKGKCNQVYGITRVYLQKWEMCPRNMSASKSFMYLYAKLTHRLSYSYMSYAYTSPLSDTWRVKNSARCPENHTNGTALATRWWMRLVQSSKCTWACRNIQKHDHFKSFHTTSLLWSKLWTFPD